MRQNLQVKHRNIRHKAIVYAPDVFIHCSSLLQYAATHCSTLQHAAACCNTLQHAATRCITHLYHHTGCICPPTYLLYSSFGVSPRVQSYIKSLYDYVIKTVPPSLCSHKCADIPNVFIHCSSPLYNTATYCNTMQHTTTHCSTLQHTATHSNTQLCRHPQCIHPQLLPTANTATRCNTLQHAATRCNTLQHTTLLTYLMNSSTAPPHLYPPLLPPPPPRLPPPAFRLQNPLLRRLVHVRGTHLLGSAI